MIARTDRATEVLQAAIAIGQTLCATAFWDAEHTQCNWIGRTIDDSTTGAPGLSAAALGPDLYAGSAGMALFLTELHGQTGDPIAHQTALGAFRRSLRSLRRFSGTLFPLSFFSSHLGLAYVAHRLIDHDPGAGLEDDRQWLLDQVAGALATPHPLDVMAGNAGAIPVLLALARHPGLEYCGEFARACGVELCATATWDGAACAWEPYGLSGEPAASPPRTGLSHGASGMAVALLELYAATGDIQFLKTARGAFAYEDRLFSPAQGNWLDTRLPYTHQDGVPVGACQTAWCHGAPGIVLAHLRAQVLDPEYADVYAAMARIALATTTAAIEHNLHLPRFDTSLCHGLAGLAEVALLCGELLGDQTYLALAANIATELIQRYGTTGDWPSGVPSGGPNPTLMLGTAGIGYYFLRLRAPQEIPSLLLMRPRNSPGSR